MSASKSDCYLSSLTVRISLFYRRFMKIHLMCERRKDINDKRKKNVTYTLPSCKSRILVGSQNDLTVRISTKSETSWMGWTLKVKSQPPKTKQRQTKEKDNNNETQQEKEKKGETRKEEGIEGNQGETIRSVPRLPPLMWMWKTGNTYLQEHLWTQWTLVKRLNKDTINSWGIRPGRSSTVGLRIRSDFLSGFIYIVHTTWYFYSKPQRIIL